MHRGAGGGHRRERQVAERVAQRQRLFEARSASCVRPSATSARMRGASACTIPNRSPSSRNRPATGATAPRPRRTGRSTAGSTRAASPSSPAPTARRARSRRTNLHRHRLGGVEVALEEEEIGAQRLSPVRARAVAELLEVRGRGLQPRLGQLDVAGQERDPGLVLATHAPTGDRRAVRRATRPRRAATPPRPTSRRTPRRSRGRRVSSPARSRRPSSRKMSTLAPSSRRAVGGRPTIWACMPSNRRATPSSPRSSARAPSRGARASATAGSTSRRSVAARPGAAAARADGRIVGREVERPVACETPGPNAPTSSERRAASRSSSIACRSMFGDTDCTGPISATSSAAVAAWWATARPGSRRCRTSPSPSPRGVRRARAWSASGRRPRARRRCGTGTTRCRLEESPSSSSASTSSRRERSGRVSRRTSAARRPARRPRAPPRCR